MGLAEKFVRQCRKPEGLLGRFVGRAMNVGHTRIRRWGLTHVSVGPDGTILDIGCGGGGAIRDMSLGSRFCICLTSFMFLFELCGQLEHATVVC